MFLIKDANVKERFGYIKADKIGYIHGSRSIIPSNGTNKVTIMLLEANIVGTVNRGNSETVSLANGSSVSFDGNFIEEDGSAYFGSVDIIMHHLDPVNEDMTIQMPGMLYAQNEEGAERMLQTLGMLAVELRGSGGEELNLAEGSTSEIKIQVDASLMSIAPATIPLWYFDEVNGYWKEEGEATLQGNMYVGTVSHFSFWNWDIPAETIALCVTTTDIENNLLRNLAVTITSATYGARTGYINNQGELCGMVPSGESLEIDIYSYDPCDNETLFSDIIGPFNSDSSITVTLPENDDIVVESIIGNFYTCNDNMVTDGYVQLFYANQTFTNTVDDGTFEINLLRCTDDNTFQIKGSDFLNLQTTDNINYTFTTPLTNIGTISACNTITEFIQYRIDNEDLVSFTGNFTAILDVIPSTSYHIHPELKIAYYPVQDNEICFFMFGALNDSNYEGTYDFLDWYNTNDRSDTGFTLRECLNMASTDNITYNLTSLGAVGEYIDINFSGDFEIFDDTQHTINGVVHVLRDY
ncbi:hypothetical protein HNV08_14685 [Winogradskyella eckloniae]|uniref:hypothetical protein n=1 Tax=Winogradskyella eckloniae TaxID=1089306 RepID=UPI001563DB76|nr:hypothetical protein [Winogradskyella eckloniae]NRD21301.1 hypothetical protein [Winogradskyella eckloniae]